MEMESKAEQDRTPYEWKKIITDKKSMSDERVGKLEEEMRLLMKQLRKVESEKKQFLSQYEKQRKRMKRNKNIGGN